MIEKNSDVHGFGSPSDAGAIRIGEWRYDAKAGELVSAQGGQARAQVVRLEPKVSQVLDRLLVDPGGLVSRTELLSAVWGDAVVVEETLTRCISLLRQVFGDERPYQYIETLPKRGYRLIAPVARFERVVRLPVSSQELPLDSWAADRVCLDACSGM